ncbi:Uncharacterized protein GBIM_01974 [Gryllus bimaculatus]|nr:Uncharacterized protein GBIM_01974 [Gryllus bimaculatus]
MLIPTVSVLRVSKEKTARIIPNAIGVATGLEKHVFGSLLSRDSTYKLMLQVWKEALAQGPPKAALPPVQVMKSEVDSVSGDIQLPEDEDSSMSGSEHSCPPTPIDCPTDISHSEGECLPPLLPMSIILSSHLNILEVPLVPLLGGEPLATSLPRVTPACAPLVFIGRADPVRPRRSKCPTEATPRAWARKCGAPGGHGPAGPVRGLGCSPAAASSPAARGAGAALARSSAGGAVRRARPPACLCSTALLVLLFLSAAFLLYRIGRVQTQFAAPDHTLSLAGRSANEVQEFLNTNLNQLAKVRQSLEALSLLIVTEEQHLQRQQRLRKETEATSQQHQQYQQHHHHHHHQQQGAAALPHDRLS